MPELFWRKEQTEMTRAFFEVYGWSFFDPKNQALATTFAKGWRAREKYDQRVIQPNKPLHEQLSI